MVMARPNWACVNGQIDLPLWSDGLPENPTNGASYGSKSDCLRLRPLKRLGYMIFKQLPWSTNTCSTSESLILNLMTKGSSCGVWKSLRSSSEKKIYCSQVRRSFLGFLETIDSSATWKTSRRCYAFLKSDLSQS